MRRSGRLSAAILGAAIVTAAVRPARADGDDLFAALEVAFVALFVADVAFAVNDIALGAKEELPDRGYAVAETIVGVPQALVFNPLFVVIAADDSNREAPGVPLLVIPTGGVTALTTHGIWRLADDGAHPVALPLVSSAVGANATLTLNALDAATDGDLVGRPMGIGQAIYTTPTLIGGTYEAIRDPEHRGGWIALTAWSGALFLHGVASAIWDGPSGDPDLAPPPPPPHPPERRERPPLLVPASIQIAPGVVTDGVAVAPGILAGGNF
jgi:hypothetical protein